MAKKGLASHVVERHPYEKKGGKFGEYWAGSASASVAKSEKRHTDEKGRHTPAKSKVAKKMAVIERARVKRDVKAGRWSGKSARQRVGGTFGS